MLLELGFRVQGSVFRVQGSGFRVQRSGFRVQGLGFRASVVQDSDLLEPNKGKYGLSLVF